MSKAYSFKIVVISEDAASAARAQELSARLANRLKPECEVDCGHWSFALLSHTPMRNQAAKEARGAGMVIFSAQRAEDLPAQVKSWIEDWSRHKRGSASALAAMLASEARALPQPPPLCSYLRETARRCGMDFFSNESDTPEEPFLSTGGMPAFLQDITPVEEDAVLECDVGERGWGIND